MSVRCLVQNFVSAFPVTQLTTKAKPNSSDSVDSCFASMEKNCVIETDLSKSDDNFNKETHAFVHSVIETLVNDTGQTSVDEKVNMVLRVSKEYFDRKNGNGIKDAVDLIDFTKESFDGTLLRVASKMFEDDQLNWGRIVTFLVFSGKLTKRAVHRYPTDPSIETQACHVVTCFIMNKLSTWIINKGGWAQFVRDMRKADENNPDASALFRTEKSFSEFLIGGALCAIPLVFTQLLLNRA